MQISLTHFLGCAGIVGALTAAAGCGPGVVCGFDQKPDSAGGCVCADDHDPVGLGCEPADLREHQSTGSSWTVLVYMAADNDLEPFALVDLEEMAQAGQSAGLQIVAQTDRAAGFSSDPVGGISDFTTTKRIEVGNGTLTEVQDLGEVNMGDPNALASFIAWGIGAYPADRYALILWNHGNAWPGFGADEASSYDLLTLQELADGIGDGLDQAGLPELHLIGFDACLMATLETAMALRPFGEYLLASEELEPGHGWDYRVLQQVKNNGSMSPTELGRAMINGYRAHAQTNQTVAIITLSLVDLYAVQSLARWVFQLADGAAQNLELLAQAVGQAQADSFEFGRNPTGASSAMIDLGQFLDSLEANAEALATTSNLTQEKLRAAVVENTTGSGTSGAQGISIYFPRAASQYATSYNNVPEMERWRGLITGYHALGGADPSFTNPDKVASVAFSDGTLIVQGQLAAEGIGSVVWAGLNYGIIDGQNNWIVLGDSEAFWNETGLVTGAWDTAALFLTQGATSEAAYLSLVSLAGGLVQATIPLEYRTNPSLTGDLVLLTVVLNAQGSIQQYTYYLITESGPGELTPAAGSVLLPLVLVVSSQGQVTWEYSSAATFDPNQTISLSLESIVSGTDFRVELYAESTSGALDSVSFNGTL